MQFDEKTIRLASLLGNAVSQ